MDKQHYIAAKEIVDILQSKKYIAYFNGGWVRDFLMKHPSNDIDIVTDAPIPVIQKLFPKIIPVGISFGILIVIYKGHQFEVATFRKEYDYKDGRRPSYITTATPEEDAKRRDFTINGMFYDPICNVLYDYVDGQRDIKKKIVRAIGDPNLRFMEDRLRMIRAVRYSVRFHFTIEPKTLHAIMDQSNHLFPSVAIERIWNEFQKMSSAQDFYKALILLYQLGLLTVILPDLKDNTLEVLQNNLRYLPHFPKKTPLIIKILELFPKYSLDQKIKLCNYLKSSKEDKALAIFWHKFERFLSILPIEKKHWDSLVEFYAHPQSELLLQIIYTKCTPSDQITVEKEHANLQKLLASPIERRKTRIFLLTGAALIHQGIPPGKHLKALLNEGEHLAIIHDLHTPAAVFKQLQQSYVWKNYIVRINSTEN
ncbi:MAG: CCA tRNA nucleotidyltransferase [Chlamydiales bacterium]